MNTLGKQLSVCREIKGLSQNQLATISKVPQSAISEIESGKRKNPGILYLQQIADALNVNLLELIKSDQSNHLPSASGNNYNSH
jgi:transcriptional regulator with XRE-family HTH domain